MEFELDALGPTYDFTDLAYGETVQFSYSGSMDATGILSWAPPLSGFTGYPPYMLYNFTGWTVTATDGGSLFNDLEPGKNFSLRVEYYSPMTPSTCALSVDLLWSEN